MFAQKTLRPIISTLAFITTLAFYSCQSEQTPPLSQKPEDNIEVQWTWKRTKTGDTNFIYGAVKNKQHKDVKQVILEFRTKDKEGKILYTQIFTLKDLPAHGQKLFSEDYPVHTNEDSGFVVVKEVNLAQ